VHKRIGGAPHNRRLKQNGLETDPAGRFLGGNFRVADKSGVIAQRPELRILGTATSTVTPFTKQVVRVRHVLAEPVVVPFHSCTGPHGTTTQSPQSRHSLTSRCPIRKMERLESRMSSE
jgi:hypothetical protein